MLDGMRASSSSRPTVDAMRPRRPARQPTPRPHLRRAPAREAPHRPRERQTPPRQARPRHAWRARPQGRRPRRRSIASGRHGQDEVAARRGAANAISDDPCSDRPHRGRVILQCAHRRHRAARRHSGRSRRRPAWERPTRTAPAIRAVASPPRRPRSSARLSQSASRDAPARRVPLPTTRIASTA